MTYLECTYLLDFLHNRRLSGLLFYIRERPKEWQVLRELVHALKTAEKEDTMAVHKHRDGKAIRCETDGADVVLVLEGKKSNIRRQLTPEKARILAVALLQAAVEAP